MLERAGGRAGWFLEVESVVVWATAGGAPAATIGAGAGRAQPARGPTGRGSADDAAAGAGAGQPTRRPTPAWPSRTVTVDARVLVITADGTDARARRDHETLRYLGTPFDVLTPRPGRR